MIIRRARRYTVNMGDFESYSFGADIEMSHRDLGVSDAALIKLSAEKRTELTSKLTTSVLKELSEQLDVEIEDASKLTKNQKSFLRKAFSTSTTTRRRRRSETSYS